MQTLLVFSVVLFAVSGLPVNSVFEPATVPASTVPLKIARKALNTTDFIFGGNRAQSGQFPMQAFYNFTASFDQEVHRCGGTIISATHVLTAAHCTVLMTLPSVLMVGGVNLNLDSPHWQWRNISGVVSHPDFDIYSDELYDDIAVIEISPPFKLNDFVKAATIVSDDETLLQEPTAVVSGFGVYKIENTKGVSSNDLLFSEVDIFSPNYCNEAWNGTLADGQICAGAAGRGIGRGDSGGPIQVFRNGKLVQIGVTSFGDADSEGEHNQDKIPVVYTRVSKYCNFIETATKGVVKCGNLSTTTSGSIPVAPQ